MTTASHCPGTPRVSVGQVQWNRGMVVSKLAKFLVTITNFYIQRALV
ncbi:MAG: hypothetical protein GY815_01695 [Gammaproteobacteria bacterium]|nr:hypothetical protein [Gammaproteobacteria bacterium]